MARPKVRFATQLDLEKFYGELPEFTTRSIVADLDGEIIAIAGLVMHSGSMTAFSEMRDEMRDYPVTIWKMGKKLMAIAANYPDAVLAQASPDEPNSLAFLQRLGFKHLGDGLCKI